MNAYQHLFLQKKRNQPEPTSEAVWSPSSKLWRHSDGWLKEVKGRPG